MIINLCSGEENILFAPQRISHELLHITGNNCNFIIPEATHAITNTPGQKLLKLILTNRFLK